MRDYLDGTNSGTSLVLISFMSILEVDNGGTVKYLMRDGCVGESAIKPKVPAPSPT